MSGKIALPSTPKLESQPLLSGENDSRSAVARRLLKGAALGAAAWFVVTSAVGAGSVWDRDGFAPWGWGKHSHPHGHGRSVDCSVWDEFDFEAPLKFGEGRHPHRHPRHPDMPYPPQSPDMPRPPTPPGAPHAPLPPHPPHPPSHPHAPHPHESQVFNISNSASEIRLASMGFLGHGVLRVESAPEGVDVVQVEVRGAHGRVCVLKGEDEEVVGVGLVGYMHGRGRKGSNGHGWWWRRGGDKSKKRDVAPPHGHLPPLDTEAQDQDVEDESFEVVNAPFHPPPGGEFPPPPPGGDFPPPPPGGRMPPPPPGHGFPHPPPPPHPRPQSHPQHTHAPILITLRVPAAELPALRTRLPFFTHDLDSLSSTSFAALDLATRDASIGLGAVVVREGGNVTVRSANAPIRGEIVAERGWTVVETKNAVVDVTVAMGGKGDAGVEVRTSNAPIIASLGLLASGRFTTSFATSNAHLALNVTSHPAGALLYLTGQTSNAPASVQLHPTYEGTFELSSSVVAPAVVVVEQAGRKVEFKRDGGSVKGSVWAENKKEDVREGGDVVVSTSNAPNTLLL